MNTLSGRFFTTPCSVAFPLPFLLSWEKKTTEFEKEQKKTLYVLMVPLFFTC